MDEERDLNTLPDNDDRYKQYLQETQRQDSLGNISNQSAEYTDRSIIGGEYDEFNEYDKGLSYGENQNPNRADNTNYKVGRALLRLPRNIAGEALTTVGTVFALPQLSGIIDGDIKNLNPTAEMFMNWGKELSQGDEGRMFSLYTDDSGLFEPGNGDWWAKTIEGWGPTFGMMLGSLGVGAVVKGAGKLAQAGINRSLKSTLAKQFDDVIQGNVEKALSKEATSLAEINTQLVEEGVDDLTDLTVDAYRTASGKKIYGAAKASKRKATRKKVEKEAGDYLDKRASTIKKLVNDYHSKQKGFDNINSFVQAGSSALVSRNSETLVEAKQTYDEVYETSKRQFPERTEEQHNKEAADAAAANYRYGMSLVLIDAFQYTKMLSLFKGAKAVAPMRSKIMSGIKAITVDAGGEGLEEGLQYTFGKNAKEQNQLFQEESIIETFFGAFGDEEFQESVVQGAIGGIAFNSPGYAYSAYKAFSKKSPEDAIADGIVDDESVRKAAANSDDPEDRALAKTATDSMEAGDDPATTKKKVKLEKLEHQTQEHFININVLEKGLKASSIYKDSVPYITAKLGLEAAQALPEDSKAHRDTKKALVDAYTARMNEANKTKEGEASSATKLGSIDGVPNASKIKAAYIDLLNAEQKKMIISGELNTLPTTDTANEEQGPVELPEDSELENFAYTAPSASAGGTVYVNETVQKASNTSTQEMEDYFLHKVFEVLDRNPEENKELINLVAKQLGGSVKIVGAKTGSGANAYTKDANGKNVKVTQNELDGARARNAGIEKHYRANGVKIIPEVRKYIKSLKEAKPESVTSNPSLDHQLAKKSLTELEADYNEALKSEGDSDLFLDEIFQRAKLSGQRAIPAIRLFNKLNGSLKEHESMVNFLKSMKVKSDFLNALVDIVDNMGMDMQLVFTAVGKKGVYDADTNTLYINSKLLKQQAAAIYNNKKDANYQLVGDSPTLKDFEKKYFTYAMIRTLINQEANTNEALLSDERLINLYEEVNPDLKAKYGIESLHDLLLELSNEAFAHELSNQKSSANYEVTSKLMEFITRLLELISGKSANVYKNVIAVTHNIMTGQEIVDMSNSPQLTRTAKKSKTREIDPIEPDRTINHLEIHTLPYAIATVRNTKTRKDSQGRNIFTEGTVTFPKIDGRKPMSLKEFTEDNNYAITSANDGSYTIMILDKNDTPRANTAFAEKFGIDLDHYHNMTIKPKDTFTVTIDKNEIVNFTKKGKVQNYEMPVLKVRHNGKVIGIIQGGRTDVGPLDGFRKAFLDAAALNNDHTHTIEVRNVAEGDFLQTTTERTLSEVMPFDSNPTLLVVNNASVTKKMPDGTTKGTGIVNKNTVKLGKKAIKGQAMNTQTSNTIVVYKDKAGRDIYFVANTKAVKEDDSYVRRLYKAFLGNIQAKNIQALVKWSRAVDDKGVEKKIPQPDVDNFMKVTYTIPATDPQVGDIIVYGNPNMNELRSDYVGTYKTLDKEGKSGMREDLADNMQQAYEESKVGRVISNADGNIVVRVMNSNLESDSAKETLTPDDLDTAYLHYADNFIKTHNVLDRPMQLDRDTANYEDDAHKLTSNLLPRLLTAPTRIFTNVGETKKVTKSKPSVNAVKQVAQTQILKTELNTVDENTVYTYGDVNGVLSSEGKNIDQFTLMRLNTKTGLFTIDSDGRQFTSVQTNQAAYSGSVEYPGFNTKVYFKDMVPGKAELVGGKWKIVKKVSFQPGSLKNLDNPVGSSKEASSAKSKNVSKSKTSFENYTDTGIVDKQTIKTIVDKIVNGEQLTIEELAMREGAASIIEERLKQLQEDVSEDDQAMIDAAGFTDADMFMGLEDVLVEESEVTVSEEKKALEDVLAAEIDKGNPFGEALESEGSQETQDMMDMFNVEEDPDSEIHCPKTTK
jgi:hypothetical protein